MGPSLKKRGKHMQNTPHSQMLLSGFWILLLTWLQKPFRVFLELSFRCLKEAYLEVYPVMLATLPFHFQILASVGFLEMLKMFVEVVCTDLKFSLQTRHIQLFNPVSVRTLTSYVSNIPKEIKSTCTIIRGPTPLSIKHVFWTTIIYFTAFSH